MPAKNLIKHNKVILHGNTALNVIPQSYILHISADRWFNAEDHLHATRPSADLSPWPDPGHRSDSLRLQTGGSQSPKRTTHVRHSLLFDNIFISLTHVYSEYLTETRSLLTYLSIKARKGWAMASLA